MYVVSKVTPANIDGAKKVIKDVSEWTKDTIIDIIKESKKETESKDERESL